MLVGFLERIVDGMALFVGCYQMDALEEENPGDSRGGPELSNYYGGRYAANSLHDESSTENDGGLVDVVVLVTQCSNTTGFQDECCVR